MISNQFLTLGLNADDLKASSKVSAVKFEYPAEKPAGQVFKGEDVAMVEKVVKLLKDEAKVI